MWCVRGEPTLFSMLHKLHCLTAVGSIETERLPGQHKSNHMLPFLLILLHLSQHCYKLTHKMCHFSTACSTERGDQSGICITFCFYILKLKLTLCTLWLVKQKSTPNHHMSRKLQCCLSEERSLWAPPPHKEPTHSNMKMLVSKFCD